MQECKYVQRSIKLKILRPLDENITWEEVGFLLRGLSFKVARASNFCMLHHLLYALKLETVHLNRKGGLYCYPYLAEEYPEVPAGILCAAETRARKLFKQHAVEILHSDRALPNFRKDVGIPVPVASYKIMQDGKGDFLMEVQLLSRQAAKTGKLPGRICLALATNWRDKTAVAALQKIAEGSLKTGVGTLFREKKNWYFVVPYQRENRLSKEATENDECIMGVKLGVQNALVYAFDRSLKRGSLSGEEVKVRQEQFYARKQNIQEQYKWSGRKGHGRERALKPIQELYEKERNFRNTANLRYASWIVEIAVKNRCGEIHLESGKGVGFGQNSILLHFWPVWDLKNRIKQKAEEHGIKVVECNVPDIWGACSECGAKSGNSVEKQSFSCPSCGYGKQEEKYGVGYVSAEYNAARNLALWRKEE